MAMLKEVQADADVEEVARRRARRLPDVVPNEVLGTNDAVLIFDELLPFVARTLDRVSTGTARGCDTAGEATALLSAICSSRFLVA